MRLRAATRFFRGGGGTAGVVSSAGAGKRLEAVISDAEAPQADRQTAQTLLGLVGSQTPK